MNRTGKILTVLLAAAFLYTMPTHACWWNYIDDMYSFDEDCGCDDGGYDYGGYDYYDDSGCDDYSYDLGGYDYYYGYDDWYDDNSGYNDYAWDITLDEVEITGSSSNDSFWGSGIFIEQDLGMDDSGSYFDTNCPQQSDSQNDAGQNDSGSIVGNVAEMNSNIGVHNAVGNQSENAVSYVNTLLESIKKMSPALKQLVENLINDNIFVIEDCDRTYYEPKEILIHIGNSPTDDKILHEMIHYLQDQLGELSYDNNSVNNEFEASWLTFLSSYLSFGIFQDNTVLGLSAQEKESIFRDLQKSIPYDITSNKMIINSNFNDFMDKYMTNDHLDQYSKEKKLLLNGDPDKSEYWHSKNYNYEYNWLNKLKIMGYNIQK